MKKCSFKTRVDRYMIDQLLVSETVDNFVHPVIVKISFSDPFRKAYLGLCYIVGKNFL